MSEWNLTIAVSFEADNIEGAEAVCQHLVDRVLEHPATIEGTAWCEAAKEARADLDSSTVESAP